MGKRLQKIYLIYYNLLMAQDLWQAHYQILSIIFSGIYRIKCKYDHDDKNCMTCGNKWKYCDCFLKYENFKDDLMEYKYLCCNKNCQHKFDEKLKKRFFKTYKFSNHDNKKFILFSRKGVYPYEYMDDWEKFNEISLPEKENFYSHLNMENLLMQIHARRKSL